MKYVIPPLVIALAKALKRAALRQQPAWEYVPEGWAAAQTNPKLKGWNDSSVIAAYRARWDSFTTLLASTLPLAVAPEHFAPTGIGATRYRPLDLLMHNVVMSYAYALAVSSRLKASLSLLDWGGGIGHYYLLSRALVPDLALDYHCRDVEVAVAYGRRVLPEACFHSDDACLERQYDFVLASGSFHYTEDWGALLARLAQATSGHLFITQLPVVHRRASFVMVQRPYSHGYNTEYIGWCLNRQQFLDRAQQHGLTLVREFINGFQPDIHRAPERAEYRGYLFEKRS